MTSKPPQLKNKEQIRFIALLPKRIRAAVLSDKRLSAIDIPTENILTLSDETFDAAIFNAAIQRLYDTDIKKVAITDRDDQVWQMTLTSKHEVELQRAKKTIKLWDQCYPRPIQPQTRHQFQPSLMGRFGADQPAIHPGIADGGRAR